MAVLMETVVAGNGKGGKMRDLLILLLSQFQYIVRITYDGRQSFMYVVI